MYLTVEDAPAAYVVKIWPEEPSGVLAPVPKIPSRFLKGWLGTEVILCYRLEKRRKQR
ncbi:hypothetical protein [Ammonifex thiophilus]|uniref:hypothetical protein n=1 Tax=Ammonifex thiophilus TaxID=444093 RepID=UPI001401E907|nr:hypothetical protein [Ammonifex thiophilus]